MAPLSYGGRAGALNIIVRRQNSFLRRSSVRRTGEAGDIFQSPSALVLTASKRDVDTFQCTNVCSIQCCTKVPTFRLIYFVVVRVIDRRGRDLNWVGGRVANLSCDFSTASFVQPMRRLRSSSVFAA